MANNKNSLAICDTCGFRYPHRVMRLNSYGMLVCPTDWDGAFNLVNSPQNKSPDVRDDENIRNPRPDVNLVFDTAWNTNINQWLLVMSIKKIWLKLIAVC